MPPTVCSDLRVCLPRTVTLIPAGPPIPGVKGATPGSGEDDLGPHCRVDLPLSAQAPAAAHTSAPMSSASAPWCCQREASHSRGDIDKFQEPFSFCPHKTYTSLCTCRSRQPAGEAWEPELPPSPPPPPSLPSGPAPTLATLAQVLPGLSGRPSSARGATGCWDTPARTGFSGGWPSHAL